MGGMGRDMLHAAVFVAVIAALLLLCCAWNLRWGRQRDENDVQQDRREEDGGDEGRHIDFSRSTSNSGQVSISLSRSSSYICMSESHASDVTTDTE